jgi:hypothetical protein
MENKKLIKYGISLGVLTLLGGAYALGNYSGKQKQMKVDDQHFQEYDKITNKIIEQGEIIEGELESKLKTQTDFLLRNNLMTEEGCLVYPPITKDDKYYEPSGLPINEGFEGPSIPGISYGSLVNQ